MIKFYYSLYKASVIFFSAKLPILRSQKQARKKTSKFLEFDLCTCTHVFLGMLQKLYQMSRINSN